MKLRIGLIAVVLLVAVSVFAIVKFDPEPPRKAIDLTARLSADGLRAAAPRPDPNTFLFGFETPANPAEDARCFASFLDYLSAATGYNFELRLVARGGTVVDDLGRGRIHFAAVGAGTMVRAMEAHGVIPLARAVDHDGRAQVRSAIVVPSRSRIRRVEDLRGKRFAFGNINSTLGHLAPRIALAGHGLFLQDFGSFEYTGSDGDCAKAVAEGRFDAGAVRETVAERMARAGSLRILDMTPPVPSLGIAAHRKIRPDILARIARALVAFQPRGRDARNLYRWESTEMAGGFVKTQRRDYDHLRGWALMVGALSDRAR